MRMWAVSPAPLQGCCRTSERDGYQNLESHKKFLSTSSLFLSPSVPSSCSLLTGFLCVTDTEVVQQIHFLFFWRHIKTLSPMTYGHAAQLWLPLQRLAPEKHLDNSLFILSLHLLAEWRQRPWRKVGATGGNVPGAWMSLPPTHPFPNHPRLDVTEKILSYSVKLLER